VAYTAAGRCCQPRGVRRAVPAPAYLTNGDDAALGAVPPGPIADTRAM
jgi:hypothetical protein